MNFHKKITPLALSIGCLISQSAFALEAWDGQEGGDTFQVIFNSQVFSNAYWVSASNCPDTASKDPDHNPWRFQRAATSAEIDQYGNPKTCNINPPPAPVDEFSSNTSYSKGDKVTLSEVEYQAQNNVADHSWVPAQKNPWERYEPLPNYSPSAQYYNGDRVTKDGQAYEALYYVQNKDPSNPANQNPAKNNGQPWFPLGAYKPFSKDELNNAPEYNSEETYSKDYLIKFNNENYVAHQMVSSVAPTDTNNPWKIIIDWGNTKEIIGTPQHSWPNKTFSPYVDVVMNAVPNFVDLQNKYNVNHFVTAFIVAKSSSQCLPSWGSSYAMNNFTTRYKNIAKLRENGGDIMVSIGGANNTPLSAACTDSQSLADMYKSIIDNMNLKALDFDIEGTWVSDQTSIDRRNEALSILQADLAKEGRDVKIWFTLPILPTGLTAEGVNVLHSAKSHNVILSGINAMTMDYGESACPSTTSETSGEQGTCSTDAIDALHNNVKSVWTEKSDEEIWQMLGTTPMIGVNDVTTEKFYSYDANLVLNHANQHNIGMIGMWSINRDLGASGSQIGNAGPTHSGIAMNDYTFSSIFSAYENGVAPIPSDLKADAGQDQTLSDIGTVTLDGSGSTIPEGDDISYQWTQVSGPSVTLSSPSSVSTTFTATTPASYTFKLTLQDDENVTSDDVNVTVHNGVIPISVNLNNSYTVHSGEKLTVTANVSYDGDDTLSYDWQLDPSLSIIGEQDSNSITIQAPIVDNNTTYPLSLTVSDEHDQTKTVTSSIKVQQNTIPEWNTDTVYHKGDQVTYDGVVYTAQNWTKGDIPSQSSNWVTTAIEEWVATKSYPKDSVVTHNGHTYIAKYWANKGDEPSVSPNWARYDN